MKDIIVSKIINADFNSASEIVDLWYNNQCKVLGIEYKGKVAAVEPKRLHRGRRGWLILFGVKSKSSTQLLESKATNPLLFTKTLYSSLSPNLVTENEYYN